MRSIKMMFVAIAAVVLVGCGQQVEVPPAHVGKVMTKDGYKDQVIPTSKFRLDPCVAYCDKLVVLDVSDRTYRESMTLFMPEDKLNMDFELRITLAVNNSAMNEIFTKVPPDTKEDTGYIPLDKVYHTYAQQIIRAEAREFLSTFSISTVASSLEAINAQLSERLTRVISSHTPFSVRYVGLAELKYPALIIEAQERAAERREMIQQEEAQLEISKVQLERNLQEQKLQRAIDVEKAQAEAEVNRILADSINDRYITYRTLNAFEKMAVSDNKVFVPTPMLDSIAGQVMLGKK